MFYILSDTEVALNELLVASRESVDHYEDAIHEINDSDKATLFRNISNQRKSFLGRLSVAIRELGDLPSVPDPDKETGEMIIEHLGASLAANDAEYIIAHRIKAEEHLQTLVDNAREMEEELTESHRELLLDLSQHIDETIQALSLENQTS